MFENLRVDIRVAAMSLQNSNGEGGWWTEYAWSRYVRVLLQLGTAAVVSHRFNHWVATLRIPIVRHLLSIFAILVRRWTMLWTGVYINPKAEIGPGLVIHTAYGIHIGKTKIGANCVVQTGVVIGCGTRRIGDKVCFGAGAKVIGDTTIGNNVVIMPNSLVLTDVPDNTTVVGVPARIRLRGGRPQRFVSPLAENNDASVNKRQPSRILVEK